MAAEFRTKPPRDKRWSSTFYGLSGCDHHQETHKLKTRPELRHKSRTLPAPPRNSMDSKPSHNLAMNDIFLMNSVPAAGRDWETALAKLGVTLPSYRTYRNGLFPLTVINGPLFTVIDNWLTCGWDVSADH